MGETELHFLNIRYFVEPLASGSRPTRGYTSAATCSSITSAATTIATSRRTCSSSAASPSCRGAATTSSGRKAPPHFVVEFTSESTREVDQQTKRAIYQDVLGVSEYFLFDPFEEYLHPRLQGYRLASGRYRPIRRLQGRLPSKVLGLHLEADAELLRLYDPAARRRLPIPPEVLEAQKGRKRREGKRKRLGESRRAPARG